MKSRFARPKRKAILAAFPILISLLLSGCNVLKRGDLMKHTDSVLAFSRIGFAAADNPRLGRDAFISLNQALDTIQIPIPYYQSDGTTPLRPGGAAPDGPLILTFDVVSPDCTVTLGGAPISSGTAVDFHNGNPRTRTFTISRQDPQGTVRTRNVEVSLVKTITPRILNPRQPGVLANPGLNLQLAMENENGDALNVTVVGNALTAAEINRDTWRLGWINGPTANVPAPPHRYNITVRPYYPGSHQLRIDAGAFQDPLGYSNSRAELTFSYDPPPIYLSQQGSDWLDPPTNTVANTGAAPETPLRTWGAALAQVNAARSDIYIAASATAYDVDGSETIDNAAVPRLGIYGGYNAAFTSRTTTGDWETRAKTMFTDSNPATPTAVGTLVSPASVLTFTNSTDDVVMDNIWVQVTGTVNFGAAVKLSDANPRLNNCIFIAPQGTSTQAAAVTAAIKIPATGLRGHKKPAAWPDRGAADAGEKL